VNPDSETNLVEAAQKGDIDSFGLLYEKYYGSIAALAFSILTDRQLAEDAAQETFAAACFNIGSLKSKDKLAPWLAGICRNISKQILRTISIRPTAIEEVNMPVSSQGDADNQQDGIKKALENLKEAEKELIVMRYFDNLPYDRIASVLDISEQAVHGRLIRTKRKIAKYLKRNGVTGDDYE
jgi:RNA polymerase sigma factor (sigma-70 family)